MSRWLLLKYAEFQTLAQEVQASPARRWRSIALTARQRLATRAHMRVA
jgi:hypothetical protein